MTTLDGCLLAAIVAAAAFLRLWDLSLVSITADEGLHGLFARYVAVFDFEKYSVVGLPSVGIRNSALFVYLLALPNFVVLHPLSGAAFIALLQVAAIVMTYRYALRWCGRTTAVTAAVLWTFSPWAVVYARNMWPPSALAPFVLLMLGAGTKWFIDGDRRALGWGMFLAFVAPQVHFSGFCAPVWMAALIAVRLQSLTAADWKKIVVAAFVGLATWAPWIYWQHAENQWMDLKQIGAAAAGKNEFSAIHLLQYFLDLLHTSGFGYWFRTPESDLPAYFPSWLATVRTIVGYSLELAFVTSVFVAAKSVVGRLLLFWTVLPMVMLIALRPLVHPHYEFLAYPAPYLVIGLGAHSLLTTPARKAFGWLLLAVVAVVFTATIDGWRRYVKNGQLDGGDRYQLSYGQRVAAVESIIKDAGALHIDIAGPFNNQQPAYMLPFLHEAARRGRRQPDRTRVYWMDECKGDELPKDETDKLANDWPYLRDVHVERSWKVGPTRIFRLVGTPAGP
jgi:4-amino-4-deoxy-L-arabinose transferase-like glycosyltransferase